MYQALYRKYRPKNFDEIVGQDVIVKTLKNTIKNDIVSHAYLLAGPRGTGKTSIAKIFAKLLNCKNPSDYLPCEKCISCEQVNNNQNIDVIEIDAASNNGVDEIREIRNKVTLVPTNSKYKIYIIDEVHMLTNQAFNALLKTLEEPPSHVIFIFATTEPHKIPKTILSRCQRFDYKKVGIDSLYNRLKYISQKENIKISDDALYEIGKLCDGGVRDSISLLDQVYAYSDEEITINDVHEVNGSLTQEEIRKLLGNILENNYLEVLNSVEKYDNNGKNIIKIVQELIEELKNFIIYINTQNKKNDFYDKYKHNNNNVYSLIKNLSNLISDMKNSNNEKILFEIELIKNMNMDSMDNNYNNNLLSNNVNNFFQLKGAKQNEDIENTSNNQEDKKIDYDIELINKLKKIRINNSLYKFSKKERENTIMLFDKLKNYIDEKKYSKYISIIRDGELKSCSDNYVMFVFKNELIADTFNYELNKIEKMIYDILKIKYKLIAINFNEWNIIRTDYNKNKNLYKFEDDSLLYNEIFNNKSNNNEQNINGIDEMFENIIVYE